MTSTLKILLYLSPKVNYSYFSKSLFLPCNVWEAVTAGHVQWGPALLVPLVDVCSIADQQLHTIQVPRQHRLMDGSHAYTDRGERKKNDFL